MAGCRGFCPLLSQFPDTFDDCHLCAGKKMSSVDLSDSDTKKFNGSKQLEQRIRDDDEEKFENFSFAHFYILMSVNFYRKVPRKSTELH
jgi:hypothetical protein